MKQISWILAVSLTLLTLAHAEDRPTLEKTRLDRNVFKAFWVIPLTTRHDLQSTRVEVLKCSIPDRVESCVERVAILPISQLRPNERLELVFEKKGLAKLFYRSPIANGSQFLLAAQDLVYQWYPRVELCQQGSLRPSCNYTLELDTASSKVTLNLFLAK